MIDIFLIGKIVCRLWIKGSDEISQHGADDEERSEDDDYWECEDGGVDEEDGHV